MTTNDFLQLLKQYPKHQLNFEYQNGSRLRADYHITEVKNIHIDATDCGGRTDSWKETVIQLWESPQIEHNGPSISARKALAILDRVHRSQPLMLDSLLKFEYGNTDFHTSQLQVSGFSADGENLILHLGAEATQCKARELCGAPEVAVPSAEECQPGSGCC